MPDAKSTMDMMHPPQRVLELYTVIQYQYLHQRSHPQSEVDRRLAVPSLLAERLHSVNDCSSAPQLAPALGGWALATELAGLLYDRQAAAQGQRYSCEGSLCFRWAWWR